MQVCDAFDVPILHLCDTPGIMVGPEVEKTALGPARGADVCCRVQSDCSLFHAHHPEGLWPGSHRDGGG